MRKCVSLIILMACVYTVNAQSMQSVFMYSFTKYVIWPEGYDQGDFEIVVLGESPLYDQLIDLSKKKKVGERTIKVTRIDNISELKTCNILFIASAKSASLPEALAKINTQPILVVTEQDGLGAKGSDINFVTKDGKLAFELNQSAASKHNLKVSNNLVSMAILI